MKFREYKGLDLVATGNEVLDRWKKNHAFEKSLELREGAPEFIFFEGPPSANGMPGIHHVMARSIKDAICRFKTQSGYKVNRRAGWDTHGLPVELGVEKMLGITKEDIGTKISVEEYIGKEDDTPSYKARINNFSKDDKQRPVYITEGRSLSESLVEQLRFRSLSEREMVIAVYIVGSIDDDGYLRRDLVSLSDDLAFTRGMEVTVEELERVLAIELLNAAQALEFRRPLKSSEPIEKLFAEFRAVVPFVDTDMVMYPLIARSVEFLQNLK